MSACVLVVEDNALNIELFSDWLEGEGYEVRVAPDLPSAFAAVEARAPDLVLLDVQLGEDDGLKLAVAMRQQPSLRHIPIIVVTAHAMVSEKKRILQAGCNAYLPKPVDRPVLLDHLKRWLAYPMRQAADT